MTLKFILRFSFVVCFLAALNACSPVETPEQKNIAVLIEMAKVEADKMKPIKPKDRTLLTKLRVRKDKMLDTAIYYPEDPHSVPTSEIGLTIDEAKNGNLTLFMHTKYYGFKPLLIQKAWTKIDGNPIDVPVKGKWNQISGSYDSFWEISYQPLDSEGIRFIKRLANTPTPTIRFEGQNSHDDYEPSERQIAAIHTVLAAYEAAMGIDIK